MGTMVVYHKALKPHLAAPIVREGMEQDGISRLLCRWKAFTERKAQDGGVELNGGARAGCPIDVIRDASFTRMGIKDGKRSAGALTRWKRREREERRKGDGEVVGEGEQFEPHVDPRRVLILENTSPHPSSPAPMSFIPPPTPACIPVLARPAL
jgi:hypothetical protein